MDRSDAIVLQWTGTDSRPRRLVLEPRTDGGFHRIEQCQRDGEWKLTGEEIVSNVSLEAPAAIMGSSSVLGP